ncbi:MAG: hypothetical protein KatS3mg114_0332 [Planctomycetaceae bacterium]|nr:MAG: hypothetical protein KatS3mg114_0332 [Planctomycetaceae bacterium]
MRGFDFSAAMDRLCRHIVRQTPAFAHIRMEQVAVGFAQARRRVSHGLQAKLVPLRFANGALVQIRHGQRWAMRRMFSGPHELLYLLTFYLPRFLDQPLDEKFVTIFHELYHISPRFDGDIRRHDGRYHVHSARQSAYDQLMAELARAYRATHPPRSLWGFLECSFDELQQRHGQVLGRRLPMPKLIRLPSSPQTFPPHPRFYEA